MLWFLLGSSVCAAGYLIGPWVLCRIARRYSANDVEIKGYRYVYSGHDEALQKRTAQRRRDAEAIKREGRQLDCGEDTQRFRRRA
jgi:hypothetical protein